MLVLEELVEVVELEELVEVVELEELVEVVELEDESSEVSSSIRIISSSSSSSSWGQSSVSSGQIIVTASGHSVSAPPSSSVMVRRPVPSAIGVSAGSGSDSTRITLSLASPMLSSSTGTVKV